MRKAWNKLVSGMNANANIRSAETQSFLPPKLTDDEIEYSDFEVTEDHAKLIEEIQYLISQNRFSDASRHVEASYEKRKALGCGIYEHELFLEPLTDFVSDSDVSVMNAELVAERIAEWYKTDPQNALAAGLYAKALHNIGYTHRGTEFADNVTREGWKKLAEYEDRAIGLLEEREADFGDHWYWRQVYFELAITDYRGKKNHAERFDRAIEKQPLSSSLWSTYAYHLLPRWHGNFRMLNELMVRAHRETREHLGNFIFLSLFEMIHEYEGPGGMLADIGTLNEVADQLSQSKDPGELSIAASFYSWAGEHEKFLNLFSRMDTLNLRYWYSINIPEWNVSYALQMVKRGG